MKRAVLFLNGALADDAFHLDLLRGDDYLVAVDGGGGHCARLGLLPQLAIGDFDSLPPDLLAYYGAAGVERLTFPTDKDSIDGELAVREVLRRGAEEVLLLGALGGPRLDMEMANLLLLSRFSDSVVRIRDERCEVCALFADQTVKIEDQVGNHLSLLPLSDTIETGESRGLRYPLAGLQFARGESRPLSNEVTAADAAVSLRAGTALLITQRK